MISGWLPYAAVGCWLLAASGYALYTARGAAERRLLQVPAAAPPRPRRSLLARLIGTVSVRLGPQARGLVSPAREQLMRRRLDAAGQPMSFDDYLGAKATWAALLCGAALLLVSSNGSVLLLPLFAGLGWLLPDFSVAGMAKRRQRRITRDLPDFLDVLSVIVASGVGFREALDRVSLQLGGPLADELRLVLARIDLGHSRRAALSELRDRNESSALGSFVAALLQADELGAPLSKTLAEISVDLRRQFSQDARRDAARAAPRVSLIVTATLVPAAALLIVGTFVVTSDIDFGAFGG